MDLEKIIDTTIMAVESVVYALMFALFVVSVWAVLLMVAS